MLTPSGFADTTGYASECASTDTDKPWYAIHVKPKCEDICSEMLRGKGYSELNAKYAVKRVWSDRVKEIRLPLFPGYIFCQFDVVKRLPVLTVPGVISILGFGKVPAPVDEQEITAVRTVLAAHLAAGPHPYLKVGQRVVVEHGPIAGIEGLVTEMKARCRLVISVSLLQRSVAVEIDRNWIRPLN